jgi:hypothetical protein
MNLTTEGLSAGAFILASYGLVAFMLLSMTVYIIIHRSRLKLLKEALNLEEKPDE